MVNPVNKVIKGYQLAERIGKGGFGEVYRAYQVAIDREVAIKVILPEYANDPNFVRMFETEAQLIARLEHPFVVPLYDYWRDAEGAYLVMRYLTGGNLQQKLLHEEQFTLEQAANLLDQIGGALSVAHKHNVIHRDIKPANILFDDSGNAYLTDFGIAKQVDIEKDTLQINGETEDDSITATPAYAAPEQLQSLTLTPQVDLYSLAYVIHEIIGGVHPFADASLMQLIYKHIEEPIPSLENVPDAVNMVLERAAAKDPEARYSSPEEMAHAFREAVSGEVSSLTHVVSLVNPYKGLRSFEESDAADFFGREALVERLLNRFNEDHLWANFLAVVGPSGSGKSSVVKAGLLPALRNRAITGSNEWFFIEMTPSSMPMQKLEAALLSVLINPPQNIHNRLTQSIEGLSQIIHEGLPEGDDLFLVIDQFEEVFTQVEDEAERIHFLKSLHHAVTQTDTRIRIVVTLRADFYDRPLLYEYFAELMRQRTEVIVPLSALELQQSILEPAKRVGLEVEDKLVAAIISDLSEEPGTLPLLQYALMEVYERRDGYTLTLEAYENSGGALGALARRAEEIYQDLTEQQSLVQQIFLRLVTLGEGVDDTRRRIPISELRAIIPDHVGLLAVLDTYGRYRLLTFDHDPQTREPTIEVAHEALIRQWQRLQLWLTDSRVDIRQQRLLGAAAEEWLKGNRDKSFLLRGNRLAQFQEWRSSMSLSLTTQEEEYLQTSSELHEQQVLEEQERLKHERELEQRARQRLQYLVGLLLIASFMGITLTINIYNQSQDANQAREIAEQRTIEVQSLAQSANARQAISNNNSDLALLLALEANNIDNPPLQSQQLLYEIARQTGARQVLAGHEEGVWTSAVSPNGRYAVTGTGAASAGSNFYQGVPTYLPLNAGQPAQNAIRIWDLETGEIVHLIETHNDTVTDLVFHPDGNSFFSASADKTIRQWDIETGEQSTIIEGHQAQILAIAINSDGSRLLASDYDFESDSSAIILWDTATGEEIQGFEGQRDVVFSVDISPDGTRALSGSGPNGPFSPSSGDNDIVLWDIESGDELLRFNGHADAVFKVMFHPNGEIVLSASADATLKVWDLASGAEINTLSGHDTFAYSMDISADGQMLMSGGFDSSIILWNLDKGQEIQRFFGHQGFATDIAFVPRQNRVLTASDDTTVRIWDVIGADHIWSKNGPAGLGLWSLALSPDESTFLTASGAQGLFAPYDGAWTIHQWDSATGEEIRRFEGGHANNIFDIVWLPDGEQFVSVGGNAFVPGGDNVMVRWDVNTGEIIQRYESETGAYSGVDITPDGKQALLASFGSVLVLVDLETGDVIRTLEGPPVIWKAVAISPDGTQALSGVPDGTIVLWDLETGEILKAFSGHTVLINHVLFTPDGRYGISAGDDALVFVWDLETGEELVRFSEHGVPVADIAISPDGEFVISSTFDGTILLWELKTGRVRARYSGHNDGVWGLTFMDNGQTALSSSFDGQIIKWQVSLFALDELIAWTQDNRYVRDLSCEEREIYSVTPLCDDEG